VNLIYKRVLLSELVTREGLDSPVIHAVRDRAVCMVNPFRCKLLHKKASFAVLSDEANQHLFSPEERLAIGDTSVDAQCSRSGARLFTTRRLTWSLCQQPEDDFVDQANDEYGGKGIVLGWETDQPAWEAACKALSASRRSSRSASACPASLIPAWWKETCRYTTA